LATSPSSDHVANPQSFGRLFTEDADFVVVGGHHLTGRDEFVKYHVNFREGPYKDSHLVWNPVRIRFIRPDVAVAEVAAEITFSAQKRTTFATPCAVQRREPLARLPVAIAIIFLAMGTPLAVISESLNDTASLVTIIEEVCDGCPLHS
jgi:uncharacterized protein (TIGR02246 family)